MDIFHIKFLIINSHKKYYIILFMDDFFKSPHGSYITFFEHLKKEQLRIENEVKEFNSSGAKSRPRTYQHPTLIGPTLNYPKNMST
jgi:hypothetical protein